MLKQNQISGSLNTFIHKWNYASKLKVSENQNIREERKNANRFDFGVCHNHDYVSGSAPIEWDRFVYSPKSITNAPSPLLRALRQQQNSDVQEWLKNLLTRPLYSFKTSPRPISLQVSFKNYNNSPTLIAPPNTKSPPFIHNFDQKWL